MGKKNPLRRRAIHRKAGTKPPEYISPEKQSKSFAQSKIYKYLWGHLTREVTDKLPQETVICWYDSHTLSLPICAVNKFLKEKRYCKRCPLFQDDKHSQMLSDLISEWEKDEMEDLDGS